MYVCMYMYLSLSIYIYIYIYIYMYVSCLLFPFIQDYGSNIIHNDTKHNTTKASN